MIFILISFLTAFVLEGLGTYVSVVGLSVMFGANPIIIALAIALDAGKLVVVSLLYGYWDKLNAVMKSYALVAGAITMIITSAGAFSFLTGEFQKAITETQEGSLKVGVLKDQIAKFEERKKQIDDQISKLPERTSVSQRLRLMNGFKSEQKDLQDKIAIIDSQLPNLQVNQIGLEAKASPILHIAKAFDIPVESAIKWVIFAIIFVFDPLAVFLIISGNFLVLQRKLKLNERQEYEQNTHEEIVVKAESPEPEKIKPVNIVSTSLIPVIVPVIKETHETKDHDYIREAMELYSGLKPAKNAQEILDEIEETIEGKSDLPEIILPLSDIKIEDVVPEESNVDLEESIDLIEQLEEESQQALNVVHPDPEPEIIPTVEPFSSKDDSITLSSLRFVKANDPLLPTENNEVGIGTGAYRSK